MTEARTLAERFRAAHPAGDGRAPSPSLRDADLTDLIEALLEEARAAWEGVVVDLDGFFAFLATRLPDGDADGLGRLKTVDLYLAYACLTGASGAAEAFAAAHAPTLRKALAGVTAEASQIDDVIQQVYEKLFVPEEGRTPAITKYDGVGELRSWVRVTAVRLALNLHRERKRERPLSPQLLLTRPDGSTGPEEGYLKRLYSDAFKQAFERALTTLDPAQRNLLRYYYLDGLTVEAIGGLYRVHKATISRRLADVREHLLTETRNALLRQLEVGASELDSIMRLIHSRLDASICRYLNES